MNRRSMILLVEDDPNDVLLMQRAFAQSNIANEIVVVRDGEEALDYLFARGAYEGRSVEQTPEVVLLDLKLPKVDGFDVLRQMRADPILRRLPVVVLTSSDQEVDKVRSYDLGANSFVTKPVGFAQLSEAVRQLGLYWLVLNQPVENR